MMGRKTLVPDGFEVPAVLETDKFRLRMLTVNDLIKDYDAVMTSSDHLQATYSQQGGWPVGLTLEEDLIDLGWHQREFTLRYSFAYTVMSLDESMCLGCMYINPSEKPDYDARITMWIRASHLDLDDELYHSVATWIDSVWPFERPGYPGRAISFEEWSNLPE